MSKATQQEKGRVTHAQPVHARSATVVIVETRKTRYIEEQGGAFHAQASTWSCFRRRALLGTFGQVVEAKDGSAIGSIGFEDQ